MNRYRHVEYMDHPVHHSYIQDLYSNHHHGNTHRNYTDNDIVNTDCMAFTWVGPVRPKLYSETLDKLSWKTKQNLELLKGRVTRIDPCYEYGIEHWHPDRRSKAVEAHRLAEEHQESLESYPGKWPKWEANKVVFASSNALDDCIGESKLEIPIRDDPEYVADQSFNFCQMCTSAEDHEKHKQHTRHMTRLSKFGDKPNVRVDYIAPPPSLGRIKKRERSPEPEERLYKLLVKTGDKSNMGTTAKVHIQIQGSHGELRKRQLRKGAGSLPFAFHVKTLESFFIKGPMIGEPQLMRLKLDGVHKADGWYLEYIDFTDVAAKVTWRFPCKNWLSLYESDHSLRRDLVPEQLDHIQREFEVFVETGKKSMAGTDSNVFLTIFGKKGSSPKFALKDRSKNLFENGQIDRFVVKTENLGQILKIRIEHDNSGFGPGWFLEKVVLRAIDDHSKVYHFPCHAWLAKDEGTGETYRDIRPASATSKGKKENKGPQCVYEFIIETGSPLQAGTDANVFIQLIGDKMKTKELTLDNDDNNFERNCTDIFTLKATDVGVIKKMRIGHDDTGIGSGWYLEKVTILKHLKQRDVSIRRKQDKQDQKNKEKEDQMKLYDDNSESDEESGGKTKSKNKKSKQKKSESELRDKKSKSKKKSKSESDPDDDVKRTKKGKDKYELDDTVFKSKNKKSLKFALDDSDTDPDDKKSKMKPKTKDEKLRMKMLGLNISDDESDKKKTSKKLKSKKKKSDSEDSDDFQTGLFSNKKSKKVKIRVNDSTEEDSDSQTNVFGNNNKSMQKKKIRKKPMKDDIDNLFGRKTKKSNDSDSDDSNSDEDSDEEKKSKKRSGKKNKKRKDSTSQSENEDDRQTNNKVVYDQYVFEVSRWLATDEGDGELIVEMKPSKKLSNLTKSLQ
ncbi:unnamed protein product [Owenia fusiformis]|uniref:Uncharacterized protein n=1 Tax=Owenia fusiformis TaxID=6347 RepID=A0A8J1XYN6_OWEFU|nr:unnamed protein product [Owenia fusiformis]